MRNNNNLSLVTLFFLLFIGQGVQAAPGIPIETEFVQPDGTIVKGFVKGDERRNWIETVDGYTIANRKLPPNARGVEGWFYVTGFDTNGNPQFSGSKADQPVPTGIQQGLRPPRNSLFDITPRPPVQRSALGTSGLISPQSVSAQGASAPFPAAPPGPFTGSVLFILAEFDDQLGTTTEADWADLLVNDVADYFNQASYGDVNLVAAAETSGTANNGVVDWVNIGATHPDPGGDFTGSATDFHEITRDAVLAADADVNFAAFDTNGDSLISSEELSVVIIVAGNESATGGPSPQVWGHAWCVFAASVPPVVDGVEVASCATGLGYAQFGELQIGNRATLGIVAHELGHLTFGLPDLYDTDSTSIGIGHYGLMGGGIWGMAPGDSALGETPVLPSAWSRYTMGWVNADEGVGVESIVAAGHPSADETNSVFRASTSVATEYFLVENRQEVGYDAGLALWSTSGFCGEAIWHIDDTKTTNSDETDRWVDLEEADGDEGPIPV